MWPYVLTKSHPIEWTTLSWLALKRDMPRLPAYFLANITLLSIYDCRLEPTTTSKLILTIIREYYHRTVLSSPKGSFYQSMYERMQAAGSIEDANQGAQFWRFAYKC
jgi:hypothetical protein